MTDPLSRTFYERHSLMVARELLGARLVRAEAGVERIVGRIVETEAYTGIDDMASHGRNHRTPRNLPMWESPGHAYVYMTRGIHWMFNVVTEPEDHPAAVLIRAIEPLEGIDTIAHRRTGRKPLEWTSGPARLAVALNITNALNRADITTTEAGIWIEPELTYSDSQIKRGPRVGMGKTPEPWYSIDWRFWVADNPYVS
jgi:DNA-3-methyladenine glycosylase